MVQLQAPSNAEGNGDGCWPLNRERLRQLLREGQIPATKQLAGITVRAVICNGMAMF